MKQIEPPPSKVTELIGYTRWFYNLYQYVNLDKTKTLSLTGAWVVDGVGAAYYLDRERVYLSGSVKSGTGAILTLPVGYRPSEDMRFATSGDGAFAELLITASTGVVSQTAGTAVTRLSLNLSFRL